MGLNVTMRGVPTQTAKFTAEPHDARCSPRTAARSSRARARRAWWRPAGMVPLGYYKDAEKSARTFRVIDGVRYSFPGDWAIVEADGSLTLLGRGSQCINTGGEKVYPEEVEEAVKRHDAVEDCLVVGVPDERFGERIVAVVSLADHGAVSDGRRLVAHVKTQLAHYKAPKDVVFVGDGAPRARTARPTTARPRRSPSRPSASAPAAGGPLGSASDSRQGGPAHVDASTVEKAAASAADDGEFLYERGRVDRLDHHRGGRRRLAARAGQRGARRWSSHSTAVPPPRARATTPSSAARPPSGSRLAATPPPPGSSDLFAAAATGAVTVSPPPDDGRAPPRPPALRASCSATPPTGPIRTAGRAGRTGPTASTTTPSAATSTSTSTGVEPPRLLRGGGSGHRPAVPAHRRRRRSPVAPPARGSAGHQPLPGRRLRPPLPRQVAAARRPGLVGRAVRAHPAASPWTLPVTLAAVLGPGASRVHRVVGRRHARPRPGPLPPRRLPGRDRPRRRPAGRAARGDGRRRSSRRSPTTTRPATPPR